jgi:predicted transglutaminase-like cysteine proteinase
MSLAKTFNRNLTSSSAGAAAPAHPRKGATQVKANQSPSGMSRRQATGLGRIVRGAFACRGASPASDGSGASSAGLLRVTLLGVLAAAFLLAPAAHSFAAGFATVEIVGTGEGEVSSVGGFNESGFYEGVPPIECHGAEPGEGQCGPSEMEEVEALAPGKDGIGLHVEADPGSEFVEWIIDEGQSQLGCPTPELESCLAVNDVGSDVHVLAVIETAPTVEHELDVTVTGEGEVDADSGAISGCREAAGTCAGDYAEDTLVTLTATADTGNELTGWTGACSGTGTCEVTMDEAKSVGAEFGPAVAHGFATVEIVGTGEGEVSSVGGFNESGFYEGVPPIECHGAEPGEGQCGPSEMEEVEALAPGKDGIGLHVEADPGSEFVEWIIDEGQSQLGCPTPELESCLAVNDVGSDVHVLAVIETAPTVEHELDVTVTGEGEVDADSGAISGCREAAGTCAGDYAEDTLVTLTATADTGNELTGWTGACSGTGTCEVTMDAAKSVSATFVAEVPPTQHELDVTVTGNGKVDADSGAISNCRASSGVCSDDYAENTLVTLTATADGGNEFTGWTGAGCSGTGTCQVTMDAAKSVGAAFDAEDEEEGGGGGGGDGGGGDDDGGGSTPPPPPPPPVQTCLTNPALCKPGLLIANGLAQVKGNKALLKARCRGEQGARCRGVAMLFAKVRQGKRNKNVAIGKTRYNLPTNSTVRVIRVKLTGKGVKLVRRSGRRGLKAKLAGRGVKNRVVKLKQQGGRKNNKRRAARKR